MCEQELGGGGPFIFKFAQFPPGSISSVQAGMEPKDRRTHRQTGAPLNVVFTNKPCDLVHMFLVLAHLPKISGVKKVDALQRSLPDTRQGMVWRLPNYTLFTRLIAMTDDSFWKPQMRKV